MSLTGNYVEDIALIYVSVLGRVPERQGLEWWKWQYLKNNWNLEKLVEEMIKAASTYEGFEDITKPSVLVEAVYQNVLGKTSFKDDDGDGMIDNDYWVKQVQEGKTTLPKLVLDIINSAITQYPDHPATKTLLFRKDFGLFITERLWNLDFDFDGKIEKEEIQKAEEWTHQMKDGMPLSEWYKILDQAKQEEIKQYIYHLPLLIFSYYDAPVWFFDEVMKAVNTSIQNNEFDKTYEFDNSAVYVAYSETQGNVTGVVLRASFDKNDVSGTVAGGVIIDPDNNVLQLLFDPIEDEYTADSERLSNLNEYFYDSKTKVILKRAGCPFQSPVW